MFFASFICLFFLFYPFPLYKSSKIRIHLKPENLETIFLLLALQMPIRFVTRYQAKIKDLEDA